jgi:hypothetical protein
VIAVRDLAPPPAAAPARLVLAIDPGPVESAWLVYDPGRPGPQDFAKESNGTVLARVRNRAFPVEVGHLAVEMIASYGMAVGKEVFETCVMIGRYVEAWDGVFSFVYRRDVKLHICGSARATDSNIRAALIDKFGAQGSKKNPGVTYGLARDTWSALAIAVTYAEGASRP